MVLNDCNMRHFRLDGSVSCVEERRHLVAAFNEDMSVSICLLTTGVGGVGLTLTGADRVVVFDPSWNPCSDDQAVDRAYRIGQKKDVVVYRLMTCSTVEEKVYGRQVFKSGLAKMFMKKSSQERYISRDEMKALFTLEDPKYVIIFVLTPNDCCSLVAPGCSYSYINLEHGKVSMKA